MEERALLELSDEHEQVHFPKGDQLARVTASQSG